ncbi:endonuclease NucS domain-containing protein [Methanoculleus oceani]|uniref:Endonuclease NucS C-terminal domain-containing protein n=1 Tax=Methanoculleus oceani TaxID=2184756 RepID=A0ABD4TIX4_9EURY|nr:endonuclease NucS domain-containing protein [Methanoculleus sp. CWC-02]MCM2466909.1 hypothetical protein [Methanoculleus sp. CWC-02]
MPAIRIGEGSELAQQPEPFRNEYELQEILAGHPVLLVDRGDSALVTISREFPFEGGFADILLIDSNGLPVIVEVKLSRNEESRREAVGRLCDYLSAMGRLTPDEVNERSAGLLEEALQSMAGAEGEENPEDRLALLKSNVASYLRAGQIRGIIVLDAAPNDLIREFSYLNEHSDLDLRLLVVERYRLSRHEYFYHSRFLVSGEADPEIKRQRLRLRLIVEKFSKLKPPIFSTHATRENVRVYREGWPAAVHYEFGDWKDSISIEIQVRHREYPKVADFLPGLRDHLSTAIPDTQRVELVTDPFGWTRLQFFFGEEVDPYRIAQSMVRLCRTEKDISTLLREGNG